MNTAKQFWALFKFQTTLNPVIWLFPLIFSASLWEPLLTGHVLELPLSSSLDNFQLIFVGFLSVMVLAPELFSSAAAVQNTWGSGTEFLLTRATDRRIIYRSKSMFLYLLVLTIPLVLLFSSLRDSPLKTTEYSKAMQNECVTQLPGTVLSKDKYGSRDQLTIPNGHVLIDSWNIWTVLLFALATQVVIWAISPLRFRRYILWAIYGAAFGVPLLSLRSGPADVDHVGANEKLFLLFAPHQMLAWLFTILAAIVVQVGCERRFARVEQ